MFSILKNFFSIPDLKKKLTYTFLFLALCRLCSFIPIPGIDSQKAVQLFTFASGGGQNLFQMLDIFSGGAFSQMTVVGLGIMPYITSTIIMQVVTLVIPSMQREMRENPEAGKRKMGRWIRIITLCLSALYAYMLAKRALVVNAQAPGVIYDGLLQYVVGGVPLLFYLVFVVALTTGTIFLMWIGEQISDKGIGNGISLIIALGILSSFPSVIGAIIQQMNLDSQQEAQINLFSLIALIALFVVIIFATILIIQGQRKIPIQHARRIVGRREVQGGTSNIPLKVNYAGVIPIIFASALLMVPASISSFSKSTFLQMVASFLSPGSWSYTIVYAILIIFFTYFWTAMQFNPDQISSDMKKNGAFIPGIRQGRPTKEYLEQSMNRLTLTGALFLAAIAIIPTILARAFTVHPVISNFFGGTSMLILVGVILDMKNQIQSFLLSKQYDGFMTKKKVKIRL